MSATNRALILADALFTLMAAREDLDRAKALVAQAAYTGQHTAESYYENEQAAYDAAALNYANAVQLVTGGET
jgi:hypothetical protein